MAKKVRKVGMGASQKTQTKGKRKAVVGGVGILPSAKSNTAMVGGIKTDNDMAMKAAKGGIPQGAGVNKNMSAGIKTDNDMAMKAAKGSLPGASSAQAYTSSITKGQTDQKAAQTADALMPFRQKGLEAVTKLRELTEALTNATTMEEINAINEQIKAFQMENASGE